MTIRRYALIPTHSRPEQLRALILSLVEQCDAIYIVDNASDPPVNVESLDVDGTIVITRDDEQPPNLSRFWNVGLNLIAYDAQGDGLTQWDVAILNDDAVVPAGWYDYVATKLRETPGVRVACTNAYGVGHAPLTKHEPDRDVTTRMCPWAFVVPGELGQRADERFRWWWGDTDWDWTARQNGGVTIWPGLQVLNTGANSSTVGELAVQAGRDGQAFAEKWGLRPW